jgi:hypothetical protein
MEIMYKVGIQNLIEFIQAVHHLLGCPKWQDYEYPQGTLNIYNDSPLERYV